MSHNSGQPRAIARRTRRSAVTILEMLMVVGLIIISIPSGFFLWEQQKNINLARGLAYRHMEVLTAANNYVSANYQTLITATASGPVAIPAGRTTLGGAQPTGSGGLQSIQAAGFLNSSFIDRNRWQQRTWLIIRQGASANSLEGVLITSGGTAVPDLVLGQAVQFGGADAGEIPTKPLGVPAGYIIGANGGWMAANSNFTVSGFVTPAAGSLAAWIVSSPTKIVGDFLWRTNINVPEANRMHTNVDVGKHELNHVDQISGGAPASADPVTASEPNSSSTSTAIRIANTLVAGRSPLGDASLMTIPNPASPQATSPNAAAQAEYLQDDGATTFPYYLRPDGSNRMKRLDLSTLVDAASWDPQGGTLPRNYPVGTRLVDALPPMVIQASYIAGDNYMIPQPQCGNPSSPDYSKARIFAMPVSEMNYTVPQATSQSDLSYTEVPVVNTVSLNASGGTITLNSTTTTIRSANSVATGTTITPTGTAFQSYATAGTGGGSPYWILHIARYSGQYDPTINPPLNQIWPTSFYETTYPTRALVQTACFYG